MNRFLNLDEGQKARQKVALDTLEKVARKKAQQRDEYVVDGTTSDG